MREVYRRKPASPDWPQPDGVVERQIDLASGQLWAPGCGPAVSDYFLAGTDPIGTCIPVAAPYPTTPGAPGEPGASPVDTSFGFPAPTTPAPTTPAPHPDTSTLTRIRSGGTVFSPGAAPIPRASRPRPSRDTTAGTSTPRDTSNPFTLPPTQRR
jgi:hypothetical protein